jgi:voltage-gated potassium channel
LYIISRGNLEDSERKLRIAGADQIINPYLITGHRMAAQLLHPGVVEFLEVIMRQGDLELRIEEILIGPESDMRDKTLGNSRVREETGVNVLAVRFADGRLFTKLDANHVLHEGDALVGLGTVDQLTALAEKACDSRKSLHVASSV